MQSNSVTELSESSPLGCSALSKGMAFSHRKSVKQCDSNYFTQFVFFKLIWRPLSVEQYATVEWCPFPFSGQRNIIISRCIALKVNPL